jgi:hypothetical protein
MENHPRRMRETFLRLNQPAPPNPASALPNNGKAAGSGTGVNGIVASGGASDGAARSEQSAKVDF